MGLALKSSAAHQGSIYAYFELVLLSRDRAEAAIEVTCVDLCCYLPSSRPLQRREPPRWRVLSPLHTFVFPPVEWRGPSLLRFLLEGWRPRSSQGRGCGLSMLSCRPDRGEEPRAGGGGGLRDGRQGGRPSSSVSEGICHFNDVIFLAWLLSVATRRGQLPP